MRNIFLAISIFCIPIFQVYAASHISHLDSVNLNGKTYSGIYIYTIFDQKLETISNGNIEKKQGLYTTLRDIIKTYPQDTQNQALEKIIEYGYKQSSLELSQYYNTTRKVTLGYTKNNYPIEAYINGDPKNGYFGIFAGIHGGYEYGTYLTAIEIKEKLELEAKTGWIIIPSINPEGLEEYFEYETQKNFYVESRTNPNNVDLNRNFCTKDFELNTFIKNGIWVATGRGGCESELETQTIVQTLKKYKFKKIVSLHSAGNIIFIPDHSISDPHIRLFATRIHKKIPNYDFDISYTSPQEKQNKIKRYEINEGGSANFTGTMEAYIYEKFNIPTLLLELPEHGKVDYNLLEITEIIK